MESEYQHKVLVVDRDDAVGKTIDRILAAQKIEYHYAADGESALALIKTAKKPFSILITGQDLNGMDGIQLLEQAKLLTPDTSRFLMMSNTQTAPLISAVNKGAIQRYIARPLDNDDLTEAITSGIKRYDIFLDSEKLLNLAKTQNTKLYDLNCELMEATKYHDQEIRRLDADNESIEKEIKALLSKESIDPDALSAQIRETIKTDSGVDLKKAEVLFSKTIQTLYARFNDLAQRNGFEMPDMEEENQ